jgi:hypothetical protein
VSDETPTDNSLSKKFLVDNGEYGHDDPTLLNNQMIPYTGTGTTADPFPPTGYGSYLTCFNPGSIAGGLSVRFDNSTDDFCPFNIQLIARNADYNLSDGEIFGYAEFEVQPWYVPTGNIQQFPVFLPFEETVELMEGTTYFAGIQTDAETTQELAVKSIDEVDSDFSTGYWAESTTGDFLWFFGIGFLTDESPAIRLVMNDALSTEEENTFVQDFVIGPNPVSTSAQVKFNLPAAAYIAYEVRDIQGRLVTFDNIGLHSKGTNAFELNVSDYAGGNYIFNLVIDGERMFGRQFNVTR